MRKYKKRVSKSVKRKNKKNDILLRKVMVAMIILSLGILLGTISYTAYKVNSHQKNVIEYRIINAEAQVVLTGGGLNGDKDAMRFGKVGLGGTGIRYIDVNSTSYAVIKIYVAGDIAKLLSVEDNTIPVQPGDDVNIPVYLHVPMDTPLGNYTGQVHVMMLKR